MPTLTLQPDETAAVDNYISTSFGSSPTAATILVGWSGTHRTRGVIAWDISSIPTTAVVTSATFTLTEETDQISSSQTVRVHRITKEVNEDCSWTYYNDGTSAAWDTAGGDYAATPVHTTTTTGGDLALTGANFTSLVQDAIDSRSGILRLLIGLGDELDGTHNTSTTQRMKYHSASAASSSDRPSLSVTYTLPATWVGSTSSTLTTASNWSTGEVPTNNVARFTSGVNLAGGTVVFSKCLFSDGWSGGIGTSSTKADIQADFFVVDLSYGDFFLDASRVSTSAADEGTLVIRRFPVSDVASVKAILNHVVILSTPKTSAGEAGKIRLGAGTDINYLTIINAKNRVIEVEVAGAIDNIRSSGLVRLTGSATVTGTLQVCSRAILSDCDLVVTGDSIFVDSQMKIGGSALSSSNTVDVSRSTVTLSSDDEEISVGNVVLNSGGDVVIDSNRGATFASIYCAGGTIRSTSPIELSVTSYSKLSSTDFRAHNFSAARNSGHFAGQTI